MDDRIIYSTSLRFWDIWDFRNKVKLAIFVSLIFCSIELVWLVAERIIILILSWSLNQPTYTIDYVLILVGFISLYFLIWLFLRKIKLSITTSGLKINRIVHRWNSFEGFYLSSPFINFKVKSDLLVEILVNPPAKLFLDKDRNALMYNLHDNFDDFVAALRPYLSEITR